MSDVTIDTLAVEITSNSAGAAKGIDELAASLMKLKGTTISSTAVKNLTDLTGALRGLGSVTSEAKKIGDLADGIKKLSTVGSMNKIINQLNKLTFPGGAKLDGPELSGTCARMTWDLNTNTLMGDHGVKMRWYPPKQEETSPDATSDAANDVMEAS